MHRRLRRATGGKYLRLQSRISRKPRDGDRCEGRPPDADGAKELNDLGLGESVFGRPAGIPGPEHDKGEMIPGRRAHQILFGPPLTFQRLEGPSMRNTEFPLD